MFSFFLSNILVPLVLPTHAVVGVKWGGIKCACYLFSVLNEKESDNCLSVVNFYCFMSDVFVFRSVAQGVFLEGQEGKDR